MSGVKRIHTAYGIFIFTMRELKNMDSTTWCMLAFYFVVVGGGSAWTMWRSLKSDASYGDTK